MPMIVLPGAPPVTVPDRVTSPDGWLAAIVDEPWAGVVLSVDYTAGSSPLSTAASVRRVRIVRTGPDGVQVAVRGAAPGWAVEGVGTAYDHEAPLGVPVMYSAQPEYADGTLGPVSSLAVEVPAPAVGAVRDLWLKSLDEPGLSARVHITTWGARESAARQDVAARAGSPFAMVGYDAHAAATVQVVVDVPPEQVEQVRRLMDAGVLLAQTRPGYQQPDSFFVPGDWTEDTTGKLGSTGGYAVGFTIAPIERPDPEGQPMRLPGWSWDTVAASFESWTAVASSYSSWAALATNGRA
ncbi:hypothetical protein DCW30_05910 [Streptomyces alfalfae]|uniref:Uncharacterized protein n=2 Tax=Streptomyces alfalfae TaxID=1642299 RepID=A0ABM6GWV1_9ACTN|nr:hypothetical protein A7J05_22965 [Streptomyces alfalfae]AYA18561.1 hypothetical protein D3X13_22075 [Streptomyces fradiae]RXX46558.1 hypothetical protein DCW30_05910 [Streptomyces alfalfae]RZM90071.1 hypothetical protein D4104_25845 [Streptomyces alfalfae]